MCTQAFQHIKLKINYQRAPDQITQYFNKHKERIMINN